MGLVFEAEQISLGRRVALKVLPARFVSKEHFMALFENEALALAQLRHPGIVSIIDRSNPTDGPPVYFVMELVEGSSIAKLLHLHGPLEPSIALDALASVADALAYAHDRGLTHRDIKPGNILIQAEDHAAKLVDFGLAVLMGDDGLEGSPRFGTPAYMAPEQRASPPSITAKCDVYAFGIVLHECLTGARPSIDNGAAVAKSVPPEVAAIVQACVAAAPDARPTASDLAGMLRAAARPTVGVIPTSGPVPVLPPGAHPESGDYPVVTGSSDAYRAVPAPQTLPGRHASPSTRRRATGSGAYAIVEPGQEEAPERRDYAAIAAARRRTDVVTAVVILLVIVCLAVTVGLLVGTRTNEPEPQPNTTADTDDPDGLEPPPFTPWYDNDESPTRPSAPNNRRPALGAVAPDDGSALKRVLGFVDAVQGRDLGSIGEAFDEPTRAPAAFRAFFQYCDFSPDSLTDQTSRLARDAATQIRVLVTLASASRLTYGVETARLSSSACVATISVTTTSRGRQQTIACDLPLVPWGVDWFVTPDLLLNVEHIVEWLADQSASPGLGHNRPLQPPNGERDLVPLDDLFDLVSMRRFERALRQIQLVSDADATEPYLTAAERLRLGGLRREVELALSLTHVGDDVPLPGDALGLYAGQSVTGYIKGACLLHKRDYAWVWDVNRGLHGVVDAPSENMAERPEPRSEFFGDVIDEWGGVDRTDKEREYQRAERKLQDLQEAYAAAVKRYSDAVTKHDRYVDACNALSREGKTLSPDAIRRQEALASQVRALVADVGAAEAALNSQRMVVGTLQESSGRPTFRPDRTDVTGHQWFDLAVFALLFEQRGEAALAFESAFMDNSFSTRRLALALDEEARQLSAAVLTGGQFDEDIADALNQRYGLSVPRRGDPNAALHSRDAWTPRPIQERWERSLMLASCEALFTHGLESYAADDDRGPSERILGLFRMRVATQTALALEDAGALGWDRRAAWLVVITP